MDENEYYYEALDDAVTLYLRKTGKTQEQLAKMMKMSANTFSWKRRGIREFTLDEVIRLADIVGFNLADLQAG